MESIAKDVIAEDIAKVLIKAVRSNMDSIKDAIKAVNEVEEHQVDPTDIDTEMALSVWAFSYNTLWLELNVEENLKQELIQLSIGAYSELTAIPKNEVARWYEQIKVSQRLVEEHAQASFLALPLMVYLGYGTYNSLQTDLLFSYAATLYVTYLGSVSGYWKKAFEIYDIQ